jgi:hypothetical protein
LRKGAGHVTHEVDHRVAVVDVFIQHVQRLRPGDDEILLYLHRDVGTIEVATQRIAVAAKFGADGGQENLHGSHGSLPCSGVL